MLELIPVISMWLMLVVGFFLGNCPCCGAFDCATCEGLTDPVSDTWEIVMSGVSGQTGCSSQDCADWNGTFEITMADGNPCFGNITINETGSHTIALAIENNQLWNLDFICGIIADLHARYEDDACLGNSSYVLSKTTDTGQCAGFPATATITAA